MEKITVSKIVKTKPSKIGSSVMVKTNEHGDARIYMLSVKDASSIQVGKQYEGEASLWKKGDDVEFWSWKWPARQGGGGGGGMTEDQLQRLLAPLNAINTNLLRLMGMYAEYMGMYTESRMQDVAKVDYAAQGRDPKAIDDAFEKAYQESKEEKEDNPFGEDFGESDDEPPIESFDDESKQ